MSRAQISEKIKILKALKKSRFATEDLKNEIDQEIAQLEEQLRSNV